MLLSSTIGGLAGLAYYNMQAHSLEYTATAKVTIEGSKLPSQLPREVLVSVQTGGRSDAKEAIDSAGSMIRQIVSYSGSPVVIREIVIDRNMDGSGWWESALLGAVIGMLLAIGAIYVWEDTSAYQSYWQQSL